MKRILVANRGEIAMRVIRAAKEMGISSVAVYSTADRLMPFVRNADIAVCIGEPKSSESYLNADLIIETALKTGADAIHPGYGFLSENAAFSGAVTKAGLIFIGPGEDSINTMGSKLGAKQSAKKFGVPMVPGTDVALNNLAEAHNKAAEIGYPILIKASAGGGGKGMRVVNNDAELESQIETAKSEALSSFGNADVFMEKYISAPRHIEIQILGDQFGNYVYLWERECSIQRRHQKLIEEAPSSILTPAVRKAMGESAVAVARACNYYSTGTVEFLVDEQLNFYFLEMNTRLQVEHCVTEMITGIDLVKEQIKIAKGEKLSITQDDLLINGHAIELRVCAEDPYNNFLPDTGMLAIYQPAKGPGIRVDDGFEQGLEVPVYYDSLVAKLVAHGPTREDAIQRLTRAIEEFEIKGINNTLTFGKWAINSEPFKTGNFDTNFINKYWKPESNEDEDKDETYALIAPLATAYIWEREDEPVTTHFVKEQATSKKWKTNRR